MLTVNSLANIGKIIGDGPVLWRRKCIIQKHVSMNKGESFKKTALSETAFQGLRSNELKERKKERKKERMKVVEEKSAGKESRRISFYFQTCR